MKRGILLFEDRTIYDEMEVTLNHSDKYYLLPFTESEDDVVALAKSNRVDIIIASASRPGLDGIDIIQMVRNNSLKNVKTILVASCYCQGVVNSVTKYKIDNLLFQPVSNESLIRRMDDLFDDEQEISDKWKKIERKVANALKELGVPANLRGYSYLRTAIAVSIDDSENLEKITKMLYPNVANVYNTTTARVERSIRHAIETAYTRGNVDVFDEYFGYTIDVNKAKPTNSEFIAMIANRLKMDC